MKHLLITIAVLVCAMAQAQQTDYVKYVNTLQGTDSNFGLSYGNTYPTIAMPFGQHFYSAQTGKNGDGWKYQYAAKEIRGFQQVHQCSPWMNDYAVFSLMPEVGTLVVDNEKRGASFSHKNEIGKPHYYKVKFDNGITTEIAPTERCAHFRFSFPGGKKAYVVFDGYTDEANVVVDAANRRIYGWVNNIKFINKREHFRCYYVIEFDQEFVSYGTWDGLKKEVYKGTNSGEGKNYGAYLEFKKGSKVQAKVTSSYISLEQAQVTLQRELGTDSKVEQTAQKGFEVWNQLLGRIKVEDDNVDNLKTFYSCMFRANLFSRKFYELDAQGNPYYFSPYDGEVHKGYMFTDNGFWDTFRSQFPLSNILHPTMQGQYMNALLDAQEQCGWLPQWSAPGETGGMVGNHAISLLADAWAKGIRTFSPKRALEAYAHEAMNKGPWGGANGRSGWKEYYELGYIPNPHGGAVAMTLEFAYDDFCGYHLATMTGNTHYANIFKRQMYNYKNVFDASVGFMRGKDIHGEWQTPFDPYDWGDPYCEGNAFHYTWSVFQDIQGLINLFGGEKPFVDQLDSVFAAPNIIKPGTYGGIIHEMKEMELANMGQYAHGNQPIQHMPYLYLYAGQPWKTQYWVRQIVSRLYNASEKGYPGDEDQGGMSSWYVLSSLGIYSVCPGTDQYALGSPAFNKGTITLENGNQFVIEAEHNSSANVYIQSATLNGVPYTKNYITYSDIANGGVLHLVMGPEPNYQRSTSLADRPFSLSQPISPAPVN